MKLNHSKKAKDYNAKELDEVLDFLNSKNNLAPKEKILLSKLTSEKAKRNSIQSAAGVFVNEELKKEIEANSLLLDIDVDKIKDNGILDRSGLDEDKQKELDESISTHKLMQPILVIENEDGTYTRIFGRRRVRSHKRLQIKKIKAFIYKGELTLQELRLMIIHENVVREDLNEYDRVRNVIELLKEPLKTDDEKEIIELSQKAKNLNDRTKDKEYIATIKESIEDMLLKSKIYNSLSTFVNALPILKMNKELIDALTSNKITFTQAKVFNEKKKAITEAGLNYDEILGYAIKESLSRREFLKYVASILPKKNISTIDEKIKKISKQFNNIDDSKKDNFFAALEKLTKKYL